MRWIGIVGALVVGLAGAGCDHSMADPTQGAIDTICACISFLPAQQDECDAELGMELNDSAACFDCVDREAGDCASEIEVCAPLCSNNPQQPVPPPSHVTQVFQEGQ